MRCHFFLLLLAVITWVSCAETRIKDHPEWMQYFTRYGIKDGCFMLRDHTHETIHYYNKERCTSRFLPASTFKIFNSLVALETAIAPDDQLVIKWDSLPRRPDWDKDLTMHDAFKVSCVPYYRELARRIGAVRMQHYLDTLKYGNMKIGGKVDTFWLDNSLKISADEQIGFLKRLYFAELTAVSERSQRIVKTMMLQEQTPEYNLYYKTGTGHDSGSYVFWVVGFVERIQNVKELKGSMNKTDLRYYPYFFALNFNIPYTDTTKIDGYKTRIDLVHDLLKDYGAIPKN